MFDWNKFKTGKYFVTLASVEDVGEFIKGYRNNVGQIDDCSHDDILSILSEFGYICINVELVYSKYALTWGLKIHYKDYDEMKWESNTYSIIPKLKPGMVVELADKTKFLVVQKYDGELMFISNDDYDSVKYYDENLENTMTEECSIERIYISEQQKRLEYYMADDNLKLLWERKSKKKMTLAEIEAELGYKVEVVDE